MTTFSSSSLQNVSSVFGGHSFSEAVDFTSLSFFGLVGSFHFVLSPNV
jgi:hypothetical protein